MSDKALVEIYVPAADRRFDVCIPLDSKMWQITRLVSAALCELSDGKFQATAETILCDRETGHIFDINMEAGELGICNGSSLMLI